MTSHPSPAVLARAAWSRLIEPGDRVAGALVAALGPVDALAWLRGLAGAPGAGRLPVGGPDGADTSAQRLDAAVRRWSLRLPGLDEARDVRVFGRLGGLLLVPEDPRWPPRLADLGAAAPPCLWVRGEPDLRGVFGRSIAVIGARACTAYGEHVTAELAAGMADRGWTVVSGGAYGIDAVAHRAALAGGGPTVAFLAGGADRPYPAGNARLLAAVLDQGGAVVSEVPPGSVPSRTRFLQRNRLIAAASVATVVVEAAWRSGALSTAAHAAALLRPVGAVPGPVTSASSAGCHRLLREGAAVCVTDAAEAIELAGLVGDDLAEPVAASGAGRVGDGLSQDGRRALDALPLRRGEPADSVARAAGLTLEEARAALGALELEGLAVQGGGVWKRTSRVDGAPGQRSTGPRDKEGQLGQRFHQ